MPKGDIGNGKWKTENGKWKGGGSASALRRWRNGAENVGTHRMRPSGYVCRFSHSGGVMGGVGDEGGGHREVYFTCL